jgi:hypothetical protein
MPSKITVTNDKVDSISASSTSPNEAIGSCQIHIDIEKRAFTMNSKVEWFFIRKLLAGLAQ